LKFQKSNSYSANRFGYNGHENQIELSLGWIDYGFRQLDPVLGVWHSADKMAESTPWISPYSYCAGDPVNHVDLLGLQSMPEQHPFYWALGWGSEEIQAWQQWVAGTSSWSSEGVGSILPPGVGGGGEPSQAYVDEYISAQNNSTAPFKGTYGAYVQMRTNLGSLGGTTTYYGESHGSGNGYGGGGSSSGGNRVLQARNNKLEDAIYQILGWFGIGTYSSGTCFGWGRLVFDRDNSQQDSYYYVTEGGFVSSDYYNTLQNAVDSKDFGENGWKQTSYTYFTNRIYNPIGYGGIYPNQRHLNLNYPHRVGRVQFQIQGFMPGGSSVLYSSDGITEFEFSSSIAISVFRYTESLSMLIWMSLPDTPRPPGDSYAWISRVIISISH
jgi:RHS repeat-associated protein